MEGGEVIADNSNNAILGVGVVWDTAGGRGGEKRKAGGVEREGKVCREEGEEGRGGGEGGWELETWRGREE